MSFDPCEPDFGQFLKALDFAAYKHRDQRRKGAQKLPYINHPIQVTAILWDTGSVRETVTLVAALLHDTVEDTDTKPEEISTNFGDEVRSIVMEVTDDKSLPKERRKELQVLDAPHKSPRARLVKLADKISNVDEVANDPPPGWSFERRREYIDWSEKVVNGLRGENQALEARFDAAVARARAMLAGESQK